MTTEVEKVSELFGYSPDGDLETVSGGVWQDMRSGTGPVTVANNTATNAAGGLLPAQHTGGSDWTAEEYAEVTLVNPTGDGTGRSGVGVRLSGDDATGDGYLCIYSRGSAALQFFALVDGSFIPVAGGDIAVSVPTGQVLKLYATTSGGDTILEAFLDEVSAGTRTDSPTQVPGGSGTRTGIAISNGATVDGFAGGILSSDEVQLLAPIQDISAGPWLTSSGSPAELWQMIDGEESPDFDYDYTTSAGTMEVKLSPGSTPSVQTGHTLRYRLRGNGTCDAVVKLKQGSTVLAQWTETNVPAVDTDYSHTLDSSPSFVITDYTDLRISVEAAP
jgi:hypothetical protein